MDVIKGRKALPKTNSFLGNSAGFVKSLYKDPMRWQLVKHTAIFLGAVFVAREFSDVDLMAPPPGVAV